MDPLKALRYELQEESMRALFSTCHELFPFVPAWKGDLPLSVLNWLGHCEDMGLLSSEEHFNLMRFVKQTEGMY